MATQAPCRYLLPALLLCLITTQALAEPSQNSTAFSQTVLELKEKMQAINLANTFLNYFFNELENSLD